MKLRHRPLLALLPLPLLFLPLVAGAGGESQSYACDDGSRIVIAVATAGDGRPQATLQLADRALTLPQVPAAAGALYRAGDLRLHTRGDEALFEDGQGATRHCRLGDTPPGRAAAAPAPATATATATSSFLDIAGEVSLRQRRTLPPDAVLIVRVQAASRAGAPARVLAEQRIELAGRQGPVPFTTTIDRDLLGKRARVTVVARIEHGGKLRFVSDQPYPALRDGQPQPVALLLQPVGRGPAR